MFGKKAKKGKAIEQPDNQIQPDIADDGFSDFFEDEQESEIKHIEQNTEENKYESGVEVELPEKKDMILYIIIDKPVFGLINYFRESGLKVSNIFSDITEAKNAVLMQSEPTRIVVIDTGLGRFTTTTMRAELIDMLGISDEQNKTTVFFTDSVLKVDTNRALGKSGKNIDWIRYQSTAIVAATILEYKEQYKYDMEDDVDLVSPENDILNFKGLTLKTQDIPRMDISGFSSDAILTHLVNNDDNVIDGFEVKL